MVKKKNELKERKGCDSVWSCSEDRRDKEIKSRKITKKSIMEIMKTNSDNSMREYKANFMIIEDLDVLNYKV